MQISKLWIVALVGACTPEQLKTGAAEGHVETQNTGTGTVTRIRVNGLGADVLLSSGDTNGYLLVSRDQLTDTSALDFSYAYPDPTDPNVYILFQGAGEIPNTAFTSTQSAAHVAVTTTFPIMRCEVNLVTSESTCAETTAKTFDLSWTKNGLGTLFERTHRLQTFGPVTTRFHGAFSVLTATVVGSFDGRAVADNSGNLLDSQSNTVIREITVEP